MSLHLPLSNTGNHFTYTNANVMPWISTATLQPTCVSYTGKVICPIHLTTEYINYIQGSAALPQG